ncbi:BCS1 N terminal-domain-containing protein [Phaeosphaeriaceae sp. PMI808]|nr:BCS1 N terminal-domain-containing protein [Phaeosphaeriaceae sp. PMI808]
MESLLSEQIFLLNFFLPGLAPVLSSIWLLLTSAPNIGRLLCFCGLLLLAGNHAVEYLRKVLENYFTLTIEVPYHNESRDMPISWVRSQSFARSAHISLATVDTTSSKLDISNKKPLRYSPWNGRFYFWYKNRLFVFKRFRSYGQSGYTQEQVSISYFGRDPDVLRYFLDECRQHYLGLVKNKTCVFENQDEEWNLSKPRSKRNVSTVVLNEESKKLLLDDASEFLKPTTRTWYSNRGIHYQRGYIFYGPPGTGKSSFALSIAGHFDLDVYVLNIPTLNNHTLQKLFTELPQHCVVLLEDIDAVGMKRTASSNSDVGKSISPQTSATRTVSISTLLNVLDGVGSPEGRLLIMTTNHIENLDAALIRPGRADQKVEFQLADEGIINQLFFFIYDPQVAIAGGDESENSLQQDGEEKVDYNLKQLAQEFVEKVPKLEFSPAEIISHLLANKRSPLDAIVGVDTWVRKIREERKKFARANSLLDNSDRFCIYLYYSRKSISPILILFPIAQPSVRQVPRLN